MSLDLDSHPVVAVASSLDTPVIPEQKVSSPPVQNVTLFRSLEDLENLDILPSSISVVPVPAQSENDSCFDSTLGHLTLSDDIASLELKGIRPGSVSLTSSPKCILLCDYPTCLETAQMTCYRCEKKSYCSRDHQQLHWESHQKECTSPLYSHEAHSKLGWVLKINYDVGGQETVMAGEEPFVILPGMPQSKDAPICINCGIVLKRTVTVVPNSRHPHPARDPATCIACHWPSCENGCKIGGGNPLNMHSVEECKALLKAQLRKFEWNGQPVIYQYLWILRIALMKRKDPVAFAKMLQLANFNGEESDRKYLTEDTKKFLDRYLPCVLELLCDTELDQVFKIIIVKFRPMLFLNPMPQRKLHALYFESSTISHSCYPNLRYFTDDSYCQSLVTLRPIQKGEPLTINFALGLIFRPTAERRKYLLKRFNIWCTCQRCEDPSEFRTYFSSPPCKFNGICTKHPQKINDCNKWPVDLVAPAAWEPTRTSYLQPVNPNPPNKGIPLLWYCPGELCKSKILRDIDILHPIEDFLKKISNAISRDDLPEMNRILEEAFQQKIIHSTHYAIFEASFKLLEMASGFISKFGPEFFVHKYYARFRFAADCFHKVYKAFVTKGVGLSIQVLRVSSIIRLAVLTDALKYELINLVEAEKILIDNYNTVEPVNLNTIKTFWGFTREKQNLDAGISPTSNKFGNLDIAEQLGISKFVKQVDIYISRKNVISNFLRNNAEAAHFGALL